MKIGLTHASLPGSADYANSYTLATISAWLKKTRPDVQIACSSDRSVLLACDEVWCTATSDAWEAVNDLGREVLAGGKKFLVGGHHATALPQTLRYGEAFRGPLEHYEQLDELPLPDWSIFAENKRPVVMTSRGCPYDCNFCSSSSFWKHYQARSAERVVEEIRYHAQRGATDIIIFDDLFAVNKRRLRAIVEQCADQGLGGLDYSCLVRSNLIDAEMVDLLKTLGVKGLAFGAESGSNRVLSLMSKKATVEDNQRAIDLLVAGGFRPTMSLVAGYPGETAEDLDKTAKFMDDNRGRCNVVNVYPCVPFPGTRLWNWFVETRKIDVLTFDWRALNLNPQTIDWDRYSLMADAYDKKRLIELVSWNESEKLKRATLVQTPIAKPAPSRIASAMAWLGRSRQWLTSRPY